MRLIHDGRTGGRHALLGAPYVALALLACVPGASRAQQQTQGSEASAGPLQEVIVTATRRAESLSKVPISVTALTQESLDRSEEHTSELQSRLHLVCRLLLDKKKHTLTDAPVLK